VLHRGAWINIIETTESYCRKVRSLRDNRSWSAIEEEEEEKTEITDHDEDGHEGCTGESRGKHKRNGGKAGSRIDAIGIMG
jgi:hypothetical protein